MAISSTQKERSRHMSTNETTNLSQELTYIPVKAIFPHKDNPRLNIGDISELTESVKKNGVLQNLTVMPKEGSDGKYTVLLGHRRLAAAKAAGLEQVPCRIVKDVDRNEQISMMLQENMQRNDLTVYEQSQSFQLMMDLGETVKTLSEKTGFSESTVRHRVKLAELDQGLLKKKEQDEAWQMNLMDLYELEKVESKAQRNDILSKATSSSDMRWRIRQAIEQAAIQKNRKVLMKKLNSMKITKGPSGCAPYMNGWDKLLEFDLRNDIPEEINIKKPVKEVFWADGYGDRIYLLAKAKKADRQLSAADMELEQKRKNRKKLTEIVKKMDADRKAYVRDIVSGKIETSSALRKEQMSKNICDKLMNIMMDSDYASISLRAWVETAENKDYWKLTSEEREKYKESLLNESLINKLFVFTVASVSHLELVGYPCGYKESDGACLKEMYEVLNLWGFRLPEEEQKVLDGTHKLYTAEGDET
jgi:ParB family chromosome partitioning protein